MSSGITYNAPTGLSGVNPSGLTVDLSWTAATQIVDPDFADVVLLLHMDNVGTPITYIDSSSYAQSVSGSNAPQVSGSAYFGAGGGLFSPTTSFLGQLNLSAGPGQLINYPTGTDFTIEFWAYPTASSLGYSVFCSDWNRLTVGGGIQMVYDPVNQNFNSASPMIGETMLPLGAPGSIPLNTWTFIALVMNGGEATVYINGVATGAPTAISAISTGPNFDIGAVAAGGAYCGSLDEFRITIGLARYTSNFTPPTGPFPGATSGGPPPGYDVYRDGVSIATFTGAPGYVDTVGSAGTYTYNVAAWDGVSEDISAESSPANVPVGAGVIPDVVGELDSVAEATITGDGFVVGTVTTVVNAAPATTVLSQSPVGGTVAELGSSVDLLESSGPQTYLVPDVTNTSVPIATATLANATGAFTVGTITLQASGIIIAGNVISQSPAGGAYAVADFPVNLVVSSGLPALTVPDLFGMTQSDAIILLLSLGLVPGAIGSAPSQFVPPGEVQAQNPSAGNPVAAGSIVSFVLSAGIPAVGTIFDIEATVISQYANSPVILQLVNNLNQYIDQSANFANFFNYVWNVDTAVGFGLDIWGVIVGVSRLLNIPNTTDYVGFYMPSESQPDQDWQPMGSDQPPQPAVGGAMYTGYNATTAYLLPDDAYRQLILAKAFANICTTTAPAINQILQNLYGPGTAFVLNTGTMAISYNLTFTPTAIQLAILQQSGIIPTPPGVAFVINTGV